MRSATNPAEAAQFLRVSGARRIAIDGTDGSGKSTLASALSEALSIKVLHLDDFIARGKGLYLAAMNQPALKSALAGAECWIVEGVCALQVLEAVAVQPDALVYIKRMSHGYWSDEDELDPAAPIEEHLAGLRASVGAFAQARGESGELGLAEEVIRYHAAYRPHSKATLEYLRTDA
jgi:hypothetical protein